MGADQPHVVVVGLAADGHFSEAHVHAPRVGPVVREGRAGPVPGLSPGKGMSA